MKSHPIYTYDDPTLLYRFYISRFMHAIFALRGRNRTELKKAAEDCAGWYWTDVGAIMRVWHDVYPDDLRMDNYINPERIEKK